ncbi:MAG TPA: aldo/keto reductase [Puia sp.]|nr:aldo/keto reductase [Puia sp.]
MEYCLLGKSDLNISRIGFGCMSLDPSYPDAENILNMAMDGGINYFDTADMYHKGENEVMLGKALRNKRKGLIIATKVGNQWRKDGSGWDWNPSKKYILTSIDQSLHRLQTDYIDLYQLHGGTIEDPIDDVIEAFEILQSAGKIRYYGISSIRPNVIREYVKRSSIVSVMMQYSLLDRRPEEEMFSLLKENRIGVLARGTVAKGLLISKPAEHYLNYSAEQVLKAAATVKLVSGNSSNPLETSVHFVLKNPAVSSAVIGIRTETQLKEALAIRPANLLDEEKFEILRNVLPANKYIDHR